ncbi:MAG: Hsp70 family protein [Myxococcales bacterium]|nr:Hsp70 family protein [Myxococcales bacterium]
MTTSAAAPVGLSRGLVRAAKIARLGSSSDPAEPVAGALALALHRQDENRRILIADFGGGTFDVGGGPGADAVHTGRSRG